MPRSKLPPAAISVLRPTRALCSAIPSSIIRANIIVVDRARPVVFRLVRGVAAGVCAGKNAGCLSKVLVDVAESALDWLCLPVPFPSAPRTPNPRENGLNAANVPRADNIRAPEALCVPAKRRQASG